MDPEKNIIKIHQRVQTWQIWMCERKNPWMIAVRLKNVLYGLYRVFQSPAFKTIQNTVEYKTKQK